MSDEGVLVIERVMANREYWHPGQNPPFEFVVLRRRTVFSPEELLFRTPYEDTAKEFLDAWKKAFLVVHNEIT